MCAKCTDSPVPRQALSRAGGGGAAGRRVGPPAAGRRQARTRARRGRGAARGLQDVDEGGRVGRRRAHRPLRRLRRARAGLGLPPRAAGPLCGEDRRAGRRQGRPRTVDLAEAEADVRAKLSGKAFGAAGTSVVIEEGMVGPEVSVFAVCDGKDAVVLPAAQDFKRVGDGDAGPNTGGMGAYSPLPWLPQGFEEDIRQRFVLPTLSELARRGIDYRGVLYAGLMLTDEGPKLVESNIRFGDPDKIGRAHV